MLEANGNLWEMEGDAKCITTNGVVSEYKGKRLLVMGGGVAREAADLYPDLPEIWGKNVDLVGNHVQAWKKTPDDPYWLVAYPTKDHPAQPSPIELVVQSAQELMGLVIVHDLKRVLLPRPGCGLGGLNWDSQVKPRIEEILDDRVTVVTY